MTLSVSTKMSLLSSIFIPIFLISTHYVMCNANKSIQYNKMLVSSEGRIVNGYPCKIGDHPYMVNVVITKTYKHHCGGTIISECWILTAGHCARRKYEYKMFTAIVGLTFSSFSKKFIKYSNTAQISPVVANYIHSRWQLNDISLMKLYAPFKQTTVVKFVRLATLSDMQEQNMRKNCEKATVIGWGDQYPKDTKGNPLSLLIPPYDPRLQCVQLRVIGKVECFQRYGQMIPDNYLCTFTRGKDACQGDSGGPLVCNGIQYGIISSGLGCAYGPFPGLYLKVAMYQTFVRNTIRRNSGLSYKCYKLVLICNVFITICSLK